MGNDNPPPKQLQSETQTQNKSLKIFYDEVDKFYTTELTKMQFTTQLFGNFDEMQHPMSGLKINRTFILEKLYLLLTQNSKNNSVNCRSLKDLAQTICNNPERAIEKSFQIFDLDNDRFISNAEFLNFMDNCFVSLMTQVERDISDGQFKVCLRDWVSKNRNVFFQGILNTFNKFKRTDPQKWSYQDFKRWVLSGENWTLDVSLGVKKYRAPLNLMCLFAIPNIK